jgi:hypothetical protein
VSKIEQQDLPQLRYLAFSVGAAESGVVPCEAGDTVRSSNAGMCRFNAPHRHAEPVSSVRRSSTAKQGALLEPMTDIMAHAFRCRAETILILKAVEAGADLAAGMTRERAVRMLTESIVFYEQMLRRYGWGLDARLASKQR